MFRKGIDMKKIVFLLILTLVLTSCTKKKKSIIPLLGLAAGSEESSSSTRSTTATNGTTGTTEQAPSSDNVISTGSTATATTVSVVPPKSTSGGPVFTVAIVSTGSNTTPVPGTATATDTNTVSTATVSSVTMSSPKTEQVTFQVLPPPEVATGGSVASGSLSGSTPTANVVTSSPEPFTFQTTRNVTLDGKVTDSNNVPLTNAIIVVKDSKGELLLQSLTDNQGHVNGTMSVKTSDEVVFISVYGNNENSNSVEVPLVIALTDGTIQYIRNISTIGDIKLPISNYTPAVVADADGDGVPDVLDAYPNDPKKATKVRVPATGVNSIAFEDLFPNAGDADLEDYVIQYYNEEDLNAQGQIVEIRGAYQHLARGAGYSHELKLRLPESVSIKYSSTVTKFDGSPVSAGHSTGVPEFTPDVAQLAAGLLILERSDRTLVGSNIGTSKFNPGYVSKIKIAFNTPVTRATLGNAPYDLYAYIINTNQEVHLPGKYFTPNCPLSQPSGVTGSGKDCFMDRNGFPWAIIVPGNFRWGIGGSNYSFNVADKTPYPKFITWYESLGSVDKDWYNFPIQERIYPNSPTEPMPYLISLNNDLGSQLMAYLGGSNGKIAFSAIGLVIVSMLVGLLIRRKNSQE
jgi:LruC domain-containing protein